MSEDVRVSEETSTQRRARILGFDYVDTSKISQKTLYYNILTVDEMRRLRVVPIRADEYHHLFGITTTTPQSAIKLMTDRFTEQRNSFVLISDSGFNEYMNLYNPPDKIVYKNIELKETGTESLVDQISKILASVRADDMLAYLVDQA